MASRKPSSYGTLLCLLGIGLGGCATTGTMPLAQGGSRAPTRIIVIQAPMVVDRARLQAVLAPDVHRKLALADEPLAQGVEHAQEFAAAAMTSALGAQPGLRVVSAPPEDQPYLDAIRGYPLGAALSQAEADRIRAHTGADALVRFGITDYGLTPLAWRRAYITFEATTTLALAVVIAYSNIPAAKAAAGAYLAQEAVEETAEGYAGFWALNVVARPVRIEAEVIRLKPVATVWQASDTGLSTFRWSRLTRAAAPSEREAQLDQATDNAARDIASALEDARGRPAVDAPGSREAGF